MASTTKETSPDMITILNAMASCDQFTPNSKDFAASEGISRTDNAMTKLKRILKGYGFEIKDKKVVKIDKDSSGDGDGTQTPKKSTNTPKKATPAAKSKEKTTPAPKKRKLEDDGEGIDENDEALFKTKEETAEVDDES